MLGAGVGIGSAVGWAVLDWGIGGGGCWLVMRLARHGASWSDGRMLYFLDGIRREQVGEEFERVDPLGFAISSE